MCNRSLLAVAVILALLPVNLAWGQANLPNNPNAATVQGPDPSGMLGYPLATVPATGALPWPISGTVTASGQPDVLSSGNSTTALLGANATFTGTFVDLGEYHGLTITSLSDKDAANVQVDWSTDGVNVKWSEVIHVPFGAQVTYSSPTRKEQYARVVYTNGSNAQASFFLTTLLTKYTVSTPYYALLSVASITTPTTSPVTATFPTLFDNNSGVWRKAIGGSAGDALGATAICLAYNGGTAGVRDGITRTWPVNPRVPSGAPGGMAVNPILYNGSSSDTQRTPAAFNTVATAAAGNTALWTPAAGKKFRLMRYMVTVTDQATQAGAGTLTFSLLDGAAGVTGQVHDVFVPALGLVNTGSLYSSGWIDLGNGYLSTAANNVLNINLSAALTAGTVRVICCGTEE